MSLANQKIESIQCDKNGVHLVLSDGQAFFRSYLWLRDHARDEESFDENNHQRLFATGNMSPAIEPSDLQLDSAGQGIRILWPNHSTLVLYTLTYLLGSQNSENFKLAWDVAPDPRIEFSKATDPTNTQLIRYLAVHGFAHVTGCPLEQASVEAIANRVGYIRNTHFGAVWSFQADQAMADSAYSSDELRSHTDGTYFRDAPGLQLLMCMEEVAEGGESTLVDGLAIANEIAKRTPKLFAALCRIKIPGIYKGDGREFRASRPMIQMNGVDVLQVSYNNYDRDRLDLSSADEKLVYQGIVEFERYANDESRQWCVKLKPSELIIFDNWRLLHGRKAFTGHRKMAGCYVNREEFESCLSRDL